METIKQIIQDIKVSNNIQGRHNDIAFRANSRTLTEEDIRILTFASNPIKDVKYEELQFDQNVFKKPSIYETLG